MMDTASPITARAVIFGEKEKAVAGLAQALSSGQGTETVNPALQGLSQATRNAAIREISSVGAGLLELDLSALLVAGWRKYTALTQAARRTAAMPGSEEIVDIVTHRISVISHPNVELLVNDVRVTTVNFDLRIEFEVKALTAVVRSGRIVALDSGRCEVTGIVAIEGVVVATRTAELDLHLLVHLGDGIPLLRGAQNINAHEFRDPQPLREHENRVWH
jgi:hypothetical protein